MWPLLGKWLPSYRLGANAENSVAILVQDDCSPAVALLQDDASLLAAYDACQWCLGTGSRMLFPQSSFHIAPLLASCAKVRLYPLAVLALLASDCSKASMNLSADTIDSSYHIPPEMESDATIHLQVSEHRLIQQCRVHVSTTTSNFLIIRGIYFASAPEVIAGITDAGVLCFMLSLTASVGLEIIHDIVRCAVQAFRLIHPDGTIHCLVSPTDTALESALTTIGFTNTLKELSAKEGNCTVLNDGLFFVAEISALPLASVCPEAISLRDTYFLIGQSNMAGRGSVADIYSESTKQSISGLCPALKWTGPPTEKESFYCYDPKEGWVMNR